MSLGVFSDKQIGITDDTQAAQEHGTDGDQRREHAAHGDGDAGGVVEEGQGQVLADRAADGAAEIQKLGDLGRIGTHQGGVGYLLPQASAREYGQRHIGLGQGRSVVDPVAHHEHLLPPPLEL